MPMVGQNSLHVANPYASNPAYRINFPVHGTVVRVIYPKDLDSLSKRHIEYDIEPLVAGLGRIKNVPLALGLHGIVDDEEMILQPAKLYVSGGDPFTTEEVGGALNTDGDQVVVQFLNGSFFNPFISHVLEHTQRGRGGTLPAKYKDKLALLTEGPTGADGFVFGDGTAGKTAVDLKPEQGSRYKHTRINGTHLALDNNGDVFLNFEAHPDDAKDLKAGDVKKKLVIQNEGEDLFRIEKDGTGKINIVLAENFAVDILVQVADGAVAVAIADNLDTLWGTLKSHLDKLFSGVSAWVPAPTDGGLALKTALTTSGYLPTNSAPAYAANVTSTKVKIPDG